MPTKKNTTPNATEDLAFQKKVWITVAIFSFIVILFLLIHSTFNVFLLILAGSLIAIFFRALSSKIQRKTGWKEGICVSISVTSTLLILAALFWLIGAKVQSQFVQLIEILPETVDKAKAWLNETTTGAKLLEDALSSQSLGKAQGFLQQFFQSTFGVLGDLYVVLFMGIFFTISPEIYIKGIVNIIPQKGQEKGQEVLDTLGAELRKWLKGTLLSMFVVFAFTAIGLAIIGMPLWLVLALLAGLISFIPNFGPLLALIPAVLLALAQSPQTALLVLGLYILIQFIESNFITTTIQKKLINMPPALIMIGQLFMGTLTGAWGLVLATPIVLIIMVLVQELYIKSRDTNSNQADK
ncbi:MAG: AI-2E family transporter [Saprospiraceae bacterium]|nr:AI-2E family transporter [Saprospiraceae bacterium]